MFCYFELLESKIFKAEFANKRQKTICKTTGQSKKGCFGFAGGKAGYDYQK